MSTIGERIDFYLKVLELSGFQVKQEAVNPPAAEDSNAVSGKSGGILRCEGVGVVRWR